MKNKKRKIVIPLGKHRIVAEVYDYNAPEFPAEIAVYICDSKEAIMQDLVIVRPQYTISDDTVKISNDTAEVLVWGDSYSEDYIKQYTIKCREPEPEEQP